MAAGDRRVFIDGCAVNRFALVNVDPLEALDGTVFPLAITPDLEAEYRRALDHLFVPPYVKKLILKLLGRCARHDAQGGGSTDRRLVALASTHLVITDDAKLYRRHAVDHPGLVAWPDIERHLATGGRLADLLSDRATRLIGPA